MLNSSTLQLNTQQKCNRSFPNVSTVRWKISYFKYFESSSVLEVTVCWHILNQHDFTSVVAMGSVNIRCWHSGCRWWGSNGWLKCSENSNGSVVRVMCYWALCGVSPLYYELVMINVCLSWSFSVKTHIERYQMTTRSYTIDWLPGSQVCWSIG